jgi:formylglycine-generating enzyme required for sulfatase activity
MSRSPFTVASGTWTIALIYLLVSYPQAILADEPELKLADDFVIPLVRIAPGKFAMGRSSRGAFVASALSFGDQGDWANEGPVRQVTISKPFSIGKFKITAEQYCKFLNSVDEPQRFVSLNWFSNIEKHDGVYRPRKGRTTHPINVAHWEGATHFCKWLSQVSGRNVRLPTEAEWEFAARGSEGRWTPWGNKEISAWSSLQGAAVDAFPENATPQGVIGLVDHVVGEWCSDFYGVRYLPGDVTDPKGPSKDQLPVKSDLWWLGTAEGESHVQRGRVRTAEWSTTSRNLGDRASYAGCYGFRIVVEDASSVNKP